MPITADYPRQTGLSMAASLWNKNRVQSTVHLLHITADSARRKERCQKFLYSFSCKDKEVLALTLI